MWKRENEAKPPAAPVPFSPSSPASPVGSAGPLSAPRREADAPPAPRPSDAGGRGVIGPSIIVRGEISGEEDLLIEGRVEGRIDMRQNAVTVGAKGHLAAEVLARVIMIDGEVEGNLTAEEQIVLRKSGRVYGDLCAPRVTIEDGARFKGSIDMEPKRLPVAVPAPANVRPAATRPSDPLAVSLAAAVASSGSGA